MNCYETYKPAHAHTHTYTHAGGSLPYILPCTELWITGVLHIKHSTAAGAGVRNHTLSYWREH